ncbi:MAG: hypothetical protein QCI38_04745 [Candidatus Thermoplasmatota archaeon]|nr:hypothetical protein [Candidatus Thermoplasmatota archaeon]
MDWKNKAACTMLAMVLLCASILIVTTPGVEGYDVEQKPITDVSVASGLTDFDVRGLSWKPNSGEGVAVGIDQGIAGFAYSITGAANAATNYTFAGSGGTAMYDVTYNGNTNNWLICGQDNAGTENVWQYDGNIFSGMGIAGDLNTMLYGIAYSPTTGHIVVVGERQDQGVVHYHDGGAWSLITVSGAPIADEMYYDVTYSAANGKFIIVGGDILGAGLIYTVDETTLTGGAVVTLIPVIPPGTSRLYGIDWSVDNGYALAVGENANLLVVDGDGLATPFTQRMLNWAAGQSWVFNAVAFGYDGDEATIVGFDGANSVAVKYIPGQTQVANVSFEVALTYNLRAVAYKDYSSPRFAMMGGYSALQAGFVKYSNTEAFHTLNVVTIYPHITGIEMYEGIVSYPAKGVNLLETQVNVDPGTETQYYTFNVSGYHQLGWAAEVKHVNLSLWYDNGNYYDGLGASSSYPGGPNSNNKAHFMYDETAAVDPWSAPLPGNNEIYLNAAACTIGAWGLANQTHSVYFVVMFGPQVRSANPGSATPTGGQLTPETSLNDPNTWDLQAHISGVNGGDGYGYDEFGFYKYLALDASGVPGSYTGSFAPNTVGNTLTPLGNNWVDYKSNTDYTLKVWTTDLVDATTNTITADNLYVGGGAAPIDATINQFVGPGVANSIPLYLAVVPNDVNNATTTLNGNNAVGNAVTWVVDIPAGTAESYYFATATYVLEYV